MEISKFCSLPQFDLNKLDKTKIASYINKMKQNYIAYWRHKHMFKSQVI